MTTLRQSSSACPAVFLILMVVFSSLVYIFQPCSASGCVSRVVFVCVAETRHVRLSCVNNCFLQKVSFESPDLYIFFYRCRVSWIKTYRKSWTPVSWLIQKKFHMPGYISHSLSLSLWCSATAELDIATMRLSPVGSASRVDLDPVSRATQQYLEVLKRNNMIWLISLLVPFQLRVSRPVPQLW